MAIKIIQELRKQNIQTPLWVAKILELLFYIPLKQIRELLLKLTVIKNLAKDWSGIIEFTLRSATSLYTVTIALFIIPRLLLTTCLFADVFLFHKIYCFYQLLWIIIIPIGFQIILAFAKQYTESKRETLELIVEKTTKENEFKVTAMLQVTEAAFQIQIKLWHYYTTILLRIEEIAQCQKSKSYLLLMLTSTLVFCISWARYILYVIHDSYLIFITNPLILNVITFFIKIILGI